MVVTEISAQIGQGEVVVVVGPNGCGKSTFMKAIAGIIPLKGGRIFLGDEEVTRLPTEQLARRGIGYVPQVDDVFENLTSKENLLMGGYLIPKRERGDRLDEIVSTYPLLAGLMNRRVHKLSGGERKLVAISRALMNRPKVLLLDEPTAGLSPKLSREILTEQIAKLSTSGAAVLLVEQRAVAALEIGDWSYVLAAGKCVLSCPARELLSREDIGEVFLGHAGEPGLKPDVPMELG
jgi:branched-chain amino acid transport system ATP-binding protein